MNEATSTLTRAGGAALACRRWRAFDDGVDPGFIDRCPKASRVALLGAAIAFAGAALGAVANATPSAGAIGGRRLGRNARI